MDYKKNRHAIYKLQYHLVVVTKYRHKVITKEINERLKEIGHPSLRPNQIDTSI